jgi:hypothetical protein
MSLKNEVVRSEAIFHIGNDSGEPYFCLETCFFAPGCLGNAALEVPFLTKQVFIFTEKQSPCHPPARAQNILAQDHSFSDSSCT